MIVEIIYARADEVFSERVELPEQSTVKSAIACSGLLQRHPEIDWRNNRIGIYGKLVSDDTPLQDNDRVEIYRPLQASKRRTY